ncbi:hypothetical protein ABBQ32_008620 [Trebouxia sp. C0010 RCD-2024]
MTQFNESPPLNGASAYGSSLMNPFSFSDEELLQHVTPGEAYIHRDNYAHATTYLRNPTLNAGLLHDSADLAELPCLLEAGEVTSAARPHDFASEAHSRSRPTSPPRLPSAACSADLPLSQGVTEAHTFDYERAESRDGLEDPAGHREKNRVAQKKFRARQKEKMRTTQKQLDDLTRKVSSLLSENSQLTTRTRILEQVVYLNTNHEQMLHANQEIMAREQELLLEEFTQFVGLLEGRTDLTIQHAKSWTMDELMTSIHPKYVEQISRLASMCRHDATGAAGTDLEVLVSMRRDHEERRALFSCYYWAIYSWNREEVVTGGAKPPALSFWKTALSGLQLSPQQVSKVVRARRCLLDKLLKVGQERRRLLSALGLQLLQRPQEEWAQSVPLQRLQNNMGQERAAASAFLFSTIDEVLTSQQEAFLDSHSYPWCPDMWQMAQLLAGGKAELDVKEHTADLDMSGVALKPLLPENTGFQLLIQPLKARGLGLRLKRGVLKNPYQTVLPAAAFPHPSIHELRPMTVFDVHCGRYRDVTFWDWVKANMPNVLSIVPH